MIDPAVILSMLAREHAENLQLRQLLAEAQKAAAQKPAE